MCAINSEKVNVHGALSPHIDRGRCCGRRPATRKSESLPSDSPVEIAGTVWLVRRQLPFRCPACL